MTRPRHSHWLWLGGLLVALIAAVWMWRARATTAATPKQAGGMDGMAGMSGMDGMRMTDDGSIALSADQIRTFGVTFGTAEVRAMSNQVRAAGNVTVDETRIVQVVPRVGGYVERLHVNVTGQVVRRGDALLELYSPELLAAQEELLVAASLQRSIGSSAIPGIPAGTTDLVGAARRRLELWGVSARQVDGVLRSGRTRRTLTLYAPASGVITERKVVQGQAVMAGELLYTISDLSRVWVEADLRGADAGMVRVGTTASIDVTGLPGRSVTGRVGYVYPTVALDARTTRARITVDNGTGRLRPGMFATVRLTTPSREALTVPTSAVVRTGERALLFIDLGDGKLMSQEIELGATAGENTEVLAGIEPGQRVVTSAQFLLDSESNLGEVMKSMLGMGGGMQGMGAMDMKGMDMEGMDMKGMPMQGTDAKRVPDAGKR